MLLTVIIVTKNPGPDIYPTLASLRKLDDPSVEILIKDNSTDKSLKIINETFRFSNFRYVHQEDEGIYDAMNQALEYAKGEFIYFLNAGDEYADSQLLDILQTSSSSYSYFYGDVFKLKPVPKIQAYTRFMNKYIIYLKNICHQGVIVKKSILEKLGGFDTNLKFNADHLLMIHLVNQYRGLKLPGLMCIYQGGGVSANYQLSKGKREYFKREISSCYNTLELILLKIADRFKSLLIGIKK